MISEIARKPFVSSRSGEIVECMRSFREVAIKMCGVDEISHCLDVAMFILFHFFFYGDAAEKKNEIGSFIFSMRSVMVSETSRTKSAVLIGS